MESALSHLSHGAVIAAILYIIMKFLLKQTETVAATRSIAIGLVASLYMILFGHGPPNKINPVLFK
tara:strand:+ start:64 stop:261 length:198 start_codon:yes stop_codon:yes gene_type:complete